MKKSKLFYYLLTLLTAFGMQLVVGGKVSAAAEQSISAADMVMKYDQQRLEIKETAGTYGSAVKNRDREIFFATGTVKRVKPKGSAAADVLVPSAWDSYDYDAKAGVSIDLSKLNRSKDNYILIHGDVSEQNTVLLVPKVTVRVSAKYNVERNQIFYYDITNKKSPVMLQGYDENGDFCSEETLEYRTACSSWYPYGTSQQTIEDLSPYLEKGATLFFRIAAGSDETVLAANANSQTPTASTLRYGNAQGDPVAYYKVKSFAGMETKVSIPKRANAPRTTVDYGKQQFRLVKGTEYRLVTENGLQEWTPGSTQAAYSLDLSDVLAQSGGTDSVLEVRLAGTEKKPASKKIRIPLTEPSTLTIRSELEGVTEADIIRQDIFHNVIEGATPEEDVIVGYVYNKSTKKLTGLRFYNGTANTYEIYISKDGKAPKASAAPVYTIKAKSAASSKDAETTITTKYVGNGDQIYVRLKADTKTSRWSGNFAGLGTVMFDPDVYVK